MSEQTLFDRIQKTDWSQEDTDHLIQLHAQNASRDEMARVLGRPYGSISGKLDRLGILSRAIEWPEDKVTTVTNMLKLNKSYSEIGDAVGKSRSAVGGIIHRLRMRGEIPPANDVVVHRARDKKPFRLPTELVAPRDTAGRMEYKRLLHAGLIEARGAQAAAEKEDTFTPLEMQKPLLELEPSECRWPYGEGPFTFCARRSSGNYCGFHTLVHRYGTKAAKSLYCEGA